MWLAIEDSHHFLCLRFRIYDKMENLISHTFKCMGHAKTYTRVKQMKVLTARLILPTV